MMDVYSPEGDVRSVCGETSIFLAGRVHERSWRLNADTSKYSPSTTSPSGPNALLRAAIVLLCVEPRYDIFLQSLLPRSHSLNR